MGYKEDRRYISACASDEEKAEKEENKRQALIVKELLNCTKIKQAYLEGEEAETVEACIVQAADAISASRPGARRENLENYIKRLEKLEEIASSFEGVEKSFAFQAGREVRIIVKPEAVSDDDMILLAREMSKKIEAELSYPGQIKVHVVRETRVVDYAK